MPVVKRTLALVLFTVLSLPAFAAGEVHLERLVETPRRVVDEAQTILIYDDSEADFGLRAFPGSEIILAMRFDAPSTPNQLLGFSLCLQRDDGAPSSGTLGINVYQAGASGPGALIDSFDASVTGVSASADGSIHSFDVSGLNVAVPQSFFLGVVLDRAENAFYHCVDENGIAGERPVFISAPPGGFTNLRDEEPDVKALILRAVVEDDEGPEPCNAGGDAIFLLGNRFRVDACWRTAGNSGTAKLAVEQGTGATMWFFNSNNPELFIKVRDACVDPFNRHWVFIAGLTNVEVTVTVTDTVTGFTRTYFNPLNMAFASVQDTASFATCP